MNKVEEYTDIDIMKDERILVEGNPFLLVEQEFLTIKQKKPGQKEGALVKLKLNSVQIVVLGIIKKLVKEGKPIRLLILKARQMGISTLIEALIFSLTSQTKGINAMVIADDIKGSNYIFEMQKLFHEMLDGHLKPLIRHSNEKKLEFDGIHSQVLIDTGENKNAGKKYTLNLVHLTEVALFPDLNEIMSGLSQSVPREPMTMIILESTAKGVGNNFYERWCEAVKLHSKGESDWIPIFIPWFELPEYSMSLQASGGMYPIEGIKGDKTKFLSSEKELKERHKLIDEQINWRRWCIINNCNGDINNFYENYPSSWQEAFVMSGDSYFDRDALLEQERRAEKLKGWPRIGTIVKLDGKWMFRECSDGRFNFYEDIEKNGQYCIGADAAEGLPHGDGSAFVVLNKRTNKTACTYNCQCDTDEFSEDLIKAGNYFNQAMIAPENKGYGSAVCKKIYSNYGNVFRRVRDNTGSLDVSDELGWNTNVKTRPQMLMQLKEEIREGSTEILCDELLEQMRTFINDPDKKKPMAEKGKKDDLVVARAIAGMVRTYYPSINRREIDDMRDRYQTNKPLKSNQGYGFRTQ